jgi:peptidoglycan biosynthesis protein MviN/MurJ (putative lipid II flippase)
VLHVVGDQRRGALIYAAVFALNLAGCYAVAGPYGSMGVAIVISASCVIESALLFVVAKHRLGLHMLIWRPAAKA